MQSKSKYITVICTCVLVFLSATFVFSQNVIAKIGDEFCQCLERQKGFLSRNEDLCYNNLFTKYEKSLMRYYSVEYSQDIPTHRFGKEFTDFLVENCTLYDPNYVSSDVEFENNTITKQSLSCEDFNDGEFYYLVEKFETQILGGIVVPVRDTIFITIKKDMFLQRMLRGKTYSLFSIKWLDKCKFQLEFKNSNDASQNINNKEGDIYKCSLTNASSNSIKLNLTRKNQIKTIQLFKLDN